MTSLVKITSCHYSSWTLPILTVLDITHSSAKGCARHSYSRNSTNSSSHPLTTGKTPTLFQLGTQECINLIGNNQGREKETQTTFTDSCGRTQPRGAAPLCASEVIQRSPFVVNLIHKETEGNENSWMGEAGGDGRSARLCFHIALNTEILRGGGQRGHPSPQ